MDSNRVTGLTVWFTGLSSAGKTTICGAIYDILSTRGHEVEWLDGDVVRTHLSKGLGYSKEDRDENIRRIGFVAELLTRHGVIVLVSAISPYREPRAEVRRRIGIHRCDVTAGTADRIARAVRLGRRPQLQSRAPRPVGSGEYHVVIGDLLYSQLLYPALLDASVPGNWTRDALALHGPALTHAVVSRMHASATDDGRIIHLHDVVGWWDGHPQPVSVEEILAQERLGDAFALISLCRQPVGTDPRASALRLGARVIDTALWEWPFASDARYLVCATVTERGKS